MSKHEKEMIVKDLKVLLANTYALYLKTQNFHWNYEGPNFYSLHILFEKQYEDLAEAIDEIAERLRALNSLVEASFSHFKEISLISEEKVPRASSEMVKELIRSHDLLVSQAKGVLAISDQENDGATSDLLSRRLDVHEKAIWMLKSSVAV